MGELAGKGYIDFNKQGERYLYTDRLPETSEKRFETINVLPRIASKYKNSEQGFYLDRMSQRDPNFMIGPSHGSLLSNEQKGYKPVIKGQVQFNKQQARQPIVHASAKYGANIYTYADSINYALQKGKFTKQKVPLFKGITTMQNTKGRDNKMYNISDGFNLNISLENNFVNLLTLNNVASAKSQLTMTQHPTPILPTIRSQTIAHSTLAMGGPTPKRSMAPSDTNLLGSMKLNKQSGMGSALGMNMNATERTSAQSKADFAKKFNNTGRRKEHGVTVGTDLSPPGTTDTKERASIGEYQSSVFSDDNMTSKKDRDKNTAGRMLDSDGFEIAQMEADDFENLTLEQKILCGYYTAKPYNKGAYPIDQLNMPKLSKA